MLGHAFDELGCVAVEFRTHFFNFTSRAAIERLGAKLDGVLRSHQVLADGSRRDTAVYSILDIEWPAVRNNLRVPAEPSRVTCAGTRISGVMDIETADRSPFRA